MFNREDGRGKGNNIQFQEGIDIDTIGSEFIIIGEIRGGDFRDRRRERHEARQMHREEDIVEIEGGQLGTNTYA